MTDDRSITLPPALLAPARARSWVADHAEDVAAEVLDDALLVVSELVTNAVRHGRPDIVLSMLAVPGGVRIAVSDAGPALPRPASAASVDKPNGRGLLIVAATATRWGVIEHAPEPGKTVWAELKRS